MHYAKIHFGDYVRDTTHLSLLEHGVYFQMMRLYYTNEKPLPAEAEKVARFIGARMEDERKAVDNILAEFFTLEDDGWHQKRIDEEIARYIERKELNGEIGRLGGRPKKPKENPNGFQTEPTGNPQITLTTNHKPINNKTLRAVSTAPASFGHFWLAWPSSPRKVAKSKCRETWIKQSLDGVADQIIAHVTAMKGSEQWRKGFEPAPQTYLNQRRWEDGSPEETKPERRLAI